MRPTIHAKWIALVFLVGLHQLCLDPSCARAQGSALTTHDALGAALAKNPTLKSAVLEVRRRRERVSVEGARGDYLLRLSGGATHTELPILTLGGVVETRRDELYLRAGVERTFAWGTQVGLETRSQVVERRINPIVTQNNVVALGPSYGLEVRATALHPLLRGSALAQRELEVEIARQERSTAEHERERVASTLLRDVLLTYWELWYGGRAVEVEREVKKRAEGQVEDQKALAEGGRAADIDVLPFETVALRQVERVALETSTKRKLSLALSELLGAPGRTDLEAKETPVFDANTVIDYNRIRQQSLSESFELRKLESELKVARSRVLVVSDRVEPRLDIEAYVSTAGLGDRDVVDPITQTASMASFSAHVGAIFELPLDGTAPRSEVAEARYEVSRLEALLQAENQRIATEVGALLETLRAAQTRLVAAAKTIEATKQLARAESERLRVGTSIPANVVLALEQQREAELRLERARIDGLRAQIELAHYTGELLRSQAGRLPAR
jgi:outer membrane protein TolC